jgi:hypothetical protein
MQNLSYTTKLRNEIYSLEADKVVKGQLLKEQFYLTYESLKPVNLLRSTFNEVTSSPDLVNNIIGSAIGLTSGFLSKKIFIGPSGSIFKKIIGSILQFGVTNVVARHPDSIKLLGQYLLQQFQHKRESNSVKK